MAKFEAEIDLQNFRPLLEALSRTNAVCEMPFLREAAKESMVGILQDKAKWQMN